MGWSFKVHGGIALAMSATALLLALLSWVPGTTLSLTDVDWLAVVVLMLPVVLAAGVRVLLTGSDKKTLWRAFWCLPGRLQATLGVLFISGFALFFMGMSNDTRQQTEMIKDGRYYVFDMTTSKRAVVEVPRSQYEKVAREDQRPMFAGFTWLCAVSAFGVFTAGELRRADARSGSVDAAT